MYIWNEYENDEIWYHDMFETEEECIADAIENYDIGLGETIAIGRVYEYVPYPDVDRMLEQMEEDAYEECGDVAYDWDVSIRKGNEEAYDELCADVANAVNKYLKKIGMTPNFHKITDVYTITL